MQYIIDKEEIKRYDSQYLKMTSDKIGVSGDLAKSLFPFLENVPTLEICSVQYYL